MILLSCPRCHRRLQASESLANSLVECPQCRTPFTVPSLSTASAPSLPPTAALAGEVVGNAIPPSVVTVPRGWRFFSSPWVVMVFVFGFLPWSEVSCNSKEVVFQVTQSGYQALYGGVSAPPAVEVLLAEQASKRLDPRHAPPENVQELRNKLRVEQAYLANVSPFLVLFWGANLALLGIICCVPLGAVRLGFVLPLCGVMLGVLILHACLGLPIERRAGQIIAAAIREDDSKGMLFLAFKRGMIECCG